MTTLTRAATIQALVNSPIRAVLATSRKQADGYALSMAGARLGRYKANPALLVVHDLHKLPVGKVVDLKVGTDNITGELVFASDPEGQMLERRVREGIINAVSISFDVDRSSVDRAGNVGSWELLETSLVGVPMDAEALIYSRARSGQAVTPQAAQNLLDAFRLPVGGRDLEKLLNAFRLAETPEERLNRIIRQVLREKLGVK